MASSVPDDATSAALSPTWGPPRVPLPPHRLAKLANALGVSTPVPAMHTQSLPSSSYLASPIALSSAMSPLLTDLRRSPTPSGSSAHTYSSAQTSRFLLHVIPPSHLPHESDGPLDAEPSASGYHCQFRRGILVPVYPTLQSQLGAIAKEYALPSTVGLVLYLITTSPSSQLNMKLGHLTDNDGMDEPGPRISEDVWRHIWLRVLRTERDETPTSAARPNGLGFGTPAAQSSPSLLQDVMSHSSALRPLISPMRPEAPQLFSPSPSTTASHSAISSRSDLDSPESATSVSEAAFPLPGLTTSALIPILAKVEFDIDKRKAPWYDPWTRNRRKRAESRGARSRASSRASGTELGENEEDVLNRGPPIQLSLVERLDATNKLPAHLQPQKGRLVPPDPEEYEQLPDEDDEDATEVMGVGRVSGDPLADVFGTDAEAWADIHAESRPQRAKKSQDPNVVDLALDAEALSALADEPTDKEEKDVEEVAELLKRSSKPSLSVSIPSSPPTKRKSSPATGSISSLSRKHIPPALDLTPSLPTSLSSQTLRQNSEGSGGLPYLQRESPSDDEHDRTMPRRTPVEVKRVGTFYDELDLGLDSTVEYDEDDPHDRRKSQVLMMAQLDEIERNLVQFSPRKLGDDLKLDTPTGMPSIASLTPPPPFHPFTPSKDLPTTPSPPMTPMPEGASWPAVPYSALSQAVFEIPDGHGKEVPAPPTIAFNGVSTELPKSPFKRSFSPGILSESAARREFDEEQDALYPPLVAPQIFRNFQADSPVLPLSPDPFGRFPSDFRATPSPTTSQDRVSPLRGVGSRNHSSTNMSTSSSVPSSRFSIDSLNSVERKEAKPPSSASIMSVKSIKKLWRKTNKLSISSSGNSSQPPMPTSGRVSPSGAPNGPSGRVSPNGAPASGKLNGQLNSQPNDQLNGQNGRVSRPPMLTDPVLPHPAPAPLKPRRKNSAQVYFDQESPYPQHPGPSRGSTPGTTPLSSTNPSPVPGSAPSNAVPPEQRHSVRKSILKSFKPPNGSLHAPQSSVSSLSSPSPSSSSPEFQYAQEQHPQARRRKSSVSELSSAMRRRTSGATASMTLSDIPPSPALPEHLISSQSQIHPQSQSRSSSRQSLSNPNFVNGNGKRTSQRQRPSMSSIDSFSSSRAPSRLMMGSPPRGPSALGVPRTSGESYEDRPSIDESQFEIVSPKTGLNHLSYPYHGLDQSMSSNE